MQSEVMGEDGLLGSEEGDDVDDDVDDDDDDERQRTGALSKRSKAGLSSDTVHSFRRESIVVGGF